MKTAILALAAILTLGGCATATVGGIDNTPEVERPDRSGEFLCAGALAAGAVATALFAPHAAVSLLASAPCVVGQAAYDQANDDG